MTGDIPQCPVCGQFMFVSDYGRHQCSPVAVLNNVLGPGSYVSPAKMQTDLALLDQAALHVKQTGPWNISWCWGKPLAHETTIHAIRDEYRRLKAEVDEFAARSANAPFDRYKFGFNRPRDTGYAPFDGPEYDQAGHRV